MEYDYFRAEESDQFSFYRIPKALFTEKEFAGLSRDARLLYGVLLDRISLSRKNGWIDANGHVFIICTLEELREVLGISHTTAIKLFKELDVSTGIGLIERIRMGKNHPSLIYVKNFVRRSRDQLSVPLKSGPKESGSPDLKNLEVRSSRCWKSGGKESGSPDFKNLEGSNTDINKTDYIYTEGSERAPAPLEKKSGYYGRFKNVCLSGNEYRELCEMYPYDCQTLIEQLSSYMKSRGKDYQNHFATLIRWAQKDGIRSCDEEDEEDKGEYL